MESKIVQKLIDPVKATLLLLATATCAVMTVYGFTYIATVHIVLEGWLFCTGFTLGYLSLWLFLVWIGVWWFDNKNYG
jgi:hypothetical protein